MEDVIEFGGVNVSAEGLMARGKPSSWPDIFTTEINGAPLRWQYANSNGPCAQRAADRILIPFAHGKIRKGTQLKLRQARVVI